MDTSKQASLVNYARYGQKLDKPAMLGTIGRSRIEFIDSFKSDVFDKVCSLAASAPEHVRPLIEYQLQGLEQSKGYRPAFFFACAQISSTALDYQEIVTRAAVLHLFHESCLLFDDLFDQARKRRGRRTAHLVFGRVPTICTAVWAKEIGYSIYSEDPAIVQSLHQCTTDLIDAEAFQWVARNALRPTKVSNWERIARGRTGALFRLAAALAGLQSDEDVIDALAICYHGIDDLHDLLGIAGLGGGGNDDLRDNIPTLATCFTAVQSREELQRVVPECVDYLRGLLSLPLSARQSEFRPFFEEMAALLSLVPLERIGA